MAGALSGVTTLDTTGVITGRVDSAASVATVMNLKNLAAASTANGVFLGFAANRTTGGDTTYASIRMESTDVGNATFAGRLRFITSTGGAAQETLRLEGTGATFFGAVSGITTLAIGGALSGVTTLATSSTINSQTISATANFTGTVTVATGLTVTTGGVTTNGTAVSTFGASGAAGYITISPGAVNGGIQINGLGASGIGLIDIAVEGGTADYDTRIIRNTGANGILQTINRGTGVIQFDPGLVAELILSPTAGASRIVGGIRIGADSTNNLLDDASTGAGTATLYIGNASINVTSDVRLKADVRDSRMDALAALNKLRVVDFAWNDPSDIAEVNRNSRGRWTGMLAQEMAQVPELAYIVNAPDRTCKTCLAGKACKKHASYWHVDLPHMAGVFVKALQQLEARLVAAGI